MDAPETPTSESKKRKTRDEDEDDTEEDDEDDDVGYETGDSQGEWEDAAVTEPPKKKSKKELLAESRLKAKLWSEELSKKTQARLAAAAEGAGAAPTIRLQAVAYDPERDSNRIHRGSHDAALELAAPPVAVTNAPSISSGASVSMAAALGQTTTTTSIASYPSVAAPTRAVHFAPLPVATVATPTRQVGPAPMPAMAHASLNQPLPAARLPMAAQLHRPHVVASNHQVPPRRQQQQHVHQPVERIQQPQHAANKQAKDDDAVAGCLGFFFLVALFAFIGAPGAKVSDPVTNMPVPCFVSTLPGPWTERCFQAKVKMACPPAGWCSGGELVSCGVDKATIDALAPSINGTECRLTITANATFQALVGRLQRLAEATVCDAPLPYEIPIRDYIAETSVNATNQEPVLMAGYRELMRGLEQADWSGGKKKRERSETLTWLEFAVKNKIVSTLQLDRDENGTVWIGFSAEAMKTLPLPGECVARRAIVSALDSFSNKVWSLATTAIHWTTWAAETSFNWIKWALVTLVSTGMKVVWTTYKAARFSFLVIWGVFLDRPLMSSVVSSTLLLCWFGIRRLM